MYYYTDRVLYGSTVDFITHPNPISRRDWLFNVCNDSRYSFNTEKGNEWYNVFLEAYTEYRKVLLLKKQRRRLYAKKKIDAGVSFFTSSPQMGKKKTLLSGNAIRRKQICEENI